MSPRHVFSLAPVKSALDTYGDAVDIYSSNGPNIGDPTYTWGDPTEERRNQSSTLVDPYDATDSIYI